MSGRKNILPAHKLVDAHSLRNTFQSDPVTINTATHVGMNISTHDVTNNVGVFSVQHRLYRDINNYSDWCTLTLSTTPTLGDDDAIELLDLRIPPGQLRVVFTATDAEVQTLTFPTKAGADDGDSVIITDGDGTTWGLALDKTGLAAAEPTYDAWVDLPAGNKVYLDISGGTTAASVAALVETALNGLTGFTAAVVTDDTAADGTMTLTMQTAGYAADPAPLNAVGDDVGTITWVATDAPDGTVDVWVGGNSEG